MADKGQKKRQEKTNKPKLTAKEKKERKDRKRAAKLRSRQRGTVGMPCCNGAASAKCTCCSTNCAAGDSCSHCRLRKRACSLR